MRSIVNEWKIGGKKDRNRGPSGDLRVNFAYKFYWLLNIRNLLPLFLFSTRLHLKSQVVSLGYLST